MVVCRRDFVLSVAFVTITADSLLKCTALEQWRKLEALLSHGLRREESRWLALCW